MIPLTPEEAERKAAARAALGRKLKGCGIGLLLPIVAAVLLVFYAIGYAMGYVDGWHNRPTVFQTKESSNAK